MPTRRRCGAVVAVSVPALLVADADARAPLAREVGVEQRGEEVAVAEVGAALVARVAQDVEREDRLLGVGPDRPAVDVLPDLVRAEAGEVLGDRVADVAEDDRGPPAAAAVDEGAADRPLAADAGDQRPLAAGEDLDHLGDLAQPVADERRVGRGDLDAGFQIRVAAFEGLGPVEVAAADGDAVGAGADVDRRPGPAGHRVDRPAAALQLDVVGEDLDRDRAVGDEVPPRLGDDGVAGERRVADLALDRLVRRAEGGVLRLPRRDVGGQRLDRPRRGRGGVERLLGDGVPGRLRGLRLDRPDRDEQAGQRQQDRGDVLSQDLHSPTISFALVFANATIQVPQSDQAIVTTVAAPP